MRKEKVERIKAFEKKDTRTFMIGLRVTKTEFNHIQRHCDKLGISKSRFFRYLWQEHIEKV